MKNFEPIAKFVTVKCMKNIVNTEVSGIAYIKQAEKTIPK